VKRVEDVSFLRTAQFAEDAGPMAHPVRPASFIEISNFYTLTIYEKGAEIVRMIHTLLGDDAFRKGSDLYFERHDGQAVTCDDFIHAMEDASGVDLKQFKRWYSQAGTPALTVSSHYDEDAASLTLNVKQMTPATPGQPTKLALHMPVRMGLIGKDGQELTTQYQGAAAKEHILHLTQLNQSFEFKGLSQAAVPSLLRGFSAPVKLNIDLEADDLLLLLSSDTDGFNRWSAAQQLAVNELTQLIEQAKSGQAFAIESKLLAGFASVLNDDSLDPAMVALILTLPTASYLAELSQAIDPKAIAKARQYLKQLIALELKSELVACYQRNQLSASYLPSPEQMARRQLKNVVLSYWAETKDEAVASVISEQCVSSDNMTDEFSALSIAVNSELDNAEDLLAGFYDKWSHESLVVNKWLMLSASQEGPDSLDKIKALMDHPAFDLKNPNKVRALLGGFSQNIPCFHDETGSGYAFLADLIIVLDKRNPQLASRLCTPLTRWRKMEETLSGLMKAELERVLAQDLSKDVYEIVSKSLA
jgi:aminopeptidase N